MHRFVMGLGALALAGGVYLAVGGSNGQSQDSAMETSAAATIVSVKVPELAGDAKIGETAFNARCSACHGANAGGIEGKGPPLVHKIYEPGHHGDMAFYMAAGQGVQSHHWRFGNMPPVEGVTKAEVASIIAYVRALQRENGIF